MVDEIEEMADVFVKAWIGKSEKQETDTHWRCGTGEASFNWRMLFEVDSPARSGNAYVLKIQIYDRDVMSSNDMICEYEMDLNLLFTDCRLT
jgi:hypothetical protein